MAKSSVPGEVLTKLEVPFRDEVYDLKEANEAQSIREAEVKLSTAFLLRPGIGRKIGLSRSEENAMASLVLGSGYQEQKVETKAG